MIPRELAQAVPAIRSSATGRPNEMMPAFFRTHPYNRQRYEAVLKRYEELVKTEPRGK